MAGYDKNPEVIYTELEDGAVLLNLASGFYYSLDAVGAEIWRLVEPGVAADALADRLTVRFDVDAEQAASAASAFLAELAREELVVPATAAAAAPATGGTDAEPRPAARSPFTTPVLVKHDEPLNQVSLHPFDPQLPLAE